MRKRRGWRMRRSEGCSQISGWVHRCAILRAPAPAGLADVTFHNSPNGGHGGPGPRVTLAALAGALAAALEAGDDEGARMIHEMIGRTLNAPAAPVEAAPAEGEHEAGRGDAGHEGEHEAAPIHLAAARALGGGARAR